jgi:uncharacterized protein (PEP-CTERM system associated)
VAASLLCTAPAFAQRWSLTSGVDSQLTWNSNTGLGTQSNQSDTTLQIQPRLTIQGEGGRLRVAGSAVLNGVAYLNHTQPNGVLPTVDLNARVEAVERLFFVEAAYRATQTSQNPFGAQPTAGSTSNTLTASQSRLSPYLQGAAGSDTRYLVRSDNSWTNEQSPTTPAPGSTVAGGSGYFGRHSAMIERDPRPFGWRFEASRDETRYRNSTTDTLTTDLARLNLTYALGVDVTGGVRLGYEDNNFQPGGRHGIYGVQGQWRPSPRTSLNAYDERRFFGSAWQLRFDHRQPQAAFNVGMSRQIDTAPQALFDLPANANVAALLDAMFASQIPDAAARAKAVQDYIARQGLPAGTLQPLTVFAQRLSLVTSNSASATWIGTRSSVTLSVSYVRTEDALDAGPLSTGSSLTNNVQTGAGLTFSRRLSPTLGLNAGIDYSRVRGRGAVNTEQSTQRGINAQLSLQAAPKTTAIAGARYRKLDSNVAVPGHDASVFVGIGHTF